MANKAGPKGKFVIHSNHQNIPKNKPVMRFISIDPGIQNFAIRIEKCETNVEMLAMSKHIIDIKRKKCGIGSTSTRIFNIIKVLDEYKEFYPNCDLLIMEDQMFVNEQMTMLKEDVLNYFIYRYPNICVVTISAKLKTSFIKLNKNMNMAKEEVVAAFELCEERDDQASLDVLLEYSASKEKTDKVHDLCVTINQLYGFRIAAGYV